ncbi:DUF3644 domain-containing protein [Rhizobium leguminosarum]|uniref:DUF3644 domain-containing protein n=1 Tax=Rhizobium leguminosarum TaxID=384 RepID=UPI003F9C4B19
MFKASALTDEEKSIIKALLMKGWRNQDVHALINYERGATINFGRISGVKKASIVPATDEIINAYQRRKRSFDPITGLNPYYNERLVRAREAMILAVTIFNNGAYGFKTEVFAVLANIAWTYLMHDYYERLRGIPILNADGTTFALSHMLFRTDCPLSKGVKQNLDALKLIRDEVEHKVFGRSDGTWLTLFQACCLNFDKTLVEFHGERVSLRHNLSIALQFGKMALEQVAQLHQYDIPDNIKALDAALTAGKTEEELNDIEYQFKVVYTLYSASKGQAHIQFVHPDSEEGKTIHNVLQKFKIADELYPLKPGDVVAAVRKAGKLFSMADHTKAWQKHKVRPPNNGANKDKTDRTHCIYHPAHKDYTYNQKWVDKLIAEAKSPAPKPLHPFKLDMQPPAENDL